MVSDFTSERCEMSCEASVLLRQIAEPQPSVKATISGVARKLDWKNSRAKELWYARARRIDAHEMDALRAAAQEQAARYERVARALEQIDPHFYRSHNDALVDVARALRAVAGPGTDSTK